MRWMRYRIANFLLAKIQIKRKRVIRMPPRLTRFQFQKEREK